MKILLADSRCLDTSVLLLWIKEKYNPERTASCADIGQEEEIKSLQKSGSQLDFLCVDFILQPALIEASPSVS